MSPFPREIQRSRKSRFFGFIIPILLAALLFSWIGYSLICFVQEADELGAAVSQNDKSIQACISSGGNPVILYGFKYEGCSKVAK